MLDSVADCTGGGGGGGGEGEGEGFTINLKTVSLSLQRAYLVSPFHHKVFLFKNSGQHYHLISLKETACLSTCTFHFVFFTLIGSHKLSNTSNDDTVALIIDHQTVTR